MNMTESNETYKKDETAEPTEDDPIIELKDEMAVEPANNGETIDLTEIVLETPSKDKNETVEAGTDAATSDDTPMAPSEELKGDEEIIDLLQAVEEPIAEHPDESKGDEEIIDLADAAEEISVTEDTEKSVNEVSELAEDETIIDLTETVAETSLETEDIGEPVSEDFDMSTEFDDISELDADLINETADVKDESYSEAVVDDALKDDFTDSLGIELGSEEDAKENLLDTGRVTNEQIEAALERVIKKMFYEKIDRLLVDTIEKTVAREIERLKKALLDDASDIET
jgi:hypothetical protein